MTSLIIGWLNYEHTKFLEAQRHYNKIDDTDSLTYSYLAFSIISPLFVERFERSLRFCHLEFDKKAISDG